MQTNAEKAEAIARRKQKDRDLAHYKRKQLGPQFARCDYTGDPDATWEEALAALPPSLRRHVGPKDKRVIR